jgi:hypothetical protein
MLGEGILPKRFLSTGICGLIKTLATFGKNRRFTNRAQGIIMLKIEG